MKFRNHLYLKSNLMLLAIIILTFISATVTAQLREEIQLSGETQLKEKSELIQVEDFKIISSSSTHIEIEFTPQYINEYMFTNAVNHNDRRGFPDVMFRSFPVFFPTDNQNSIEILDAKFEDIRNFDLLPVPTMIKDSEDIGMVPSFIKDEKAYSTNTFYPFEPANEVFAGALRNKYFGYINIYPIQYNPSTKQLKKYSYLRIRVNFNGSPVLINKSLSREERNFFKYSAINSDVAMEWSTIEFNSGTDSFGIMNSIFSTGNFHKIEVKENGIYKLDKTMLENAGIDLSNVDPRTIKIYGNGGYELPYNNTIQVPIDPVENRIFIEGEVDGVFNDGDYILFYGRSPHNWIYDPIRKTYFHHTHKFSNSNFYFITYNGNPGLRIQMENSINNPNINPLPYFKEKMFEDPVVNNLGSTGYIWLSQRISVNEAFNINKELNGYIDGSNVNFRFRFGNGSSVWAYFRLEDINSNFIATQGVFPINAAFSHINLVNLGDADLGVNYPLLPGRTSVNFRASLPSSSGNNPNVAGYYDYYEILYDKNFSAQNNLLSFSTPDTSAIVEYRISNLTTEDIKIFNTTSQSDVRLINPLSIVNGVATFQASHIEGSPEDFIVIGGNNYKSPVSISGRMENQNLKGEITSGASFLILTPKEFIPAATRLKAQRERPGPEYLKTQIIDIEMLYNEFSGGLQDPTAIRNYLKYTYNNWKERPVYVMFFGDGSYDFKNAYGLYNNNFRNWLPPLQKASSTSNDVESYCSDDFVLDVTQSYIHQPGSGIIVDFATGRACVNTIAEANTIVDKIISYESPSTHGKWKNKNMYVADDGWTTENTGGEEGPLHTQQCEQLSENFTPKHFEKEKVYIVTYPTVITPQGRRKPGANVDIIKGWNEGRLVINYTGHGSVDLWAHERIFDRQVSIPQLNNKDLYPFVTIASCDLARYDDPFFISAGEQLVNEANRGAIGVMAAVRPVYSSPNAVFNNRLWENFLYLKDTINLPIRIGLALFNVKQVLYFDNDLKFTLIADPTLRVRMPQYFTNIDSINGIPGVKLSQMKALQKVTVNGSILRSDSTFWNDYNGEIDVKVLDVDKYVNFVDFGYHFNFRRDGGTIFAGKTNVVNGLWNVEFIVPRDISYSTGRGKIITYFKNSESDGAGYSDNFIMSGLDTNAVADTTGPEVNVYLDSRNFRSGDMVNQKPKLIVDFYDEHGINLTGTIGHKIEGTLNGDENNKIDLTPFYETVSGYQRGTLEYNFEDLTDGKYVLKISAWDTYNNPGSAIVEFNVKSSSDLAIANIFNYPNPMRDITSFTFQHNFDEPLTTDIKIYTVSGRLIKELNKTNITDKFVSLEWDGRDTDGDEIANGTYLYKIIIKSDDGNFSKTSIGKLAKLK